MEAASNSAGVIETRVIAALQTCYDPEIPVNIYALGLIYGIKVNPANAVTIRMTLTAPNCPLAETLPEEVEAKVRAVLDVSDVKVEVVFDPPWDLQKMSPAAKLELGMW